MTPLFALVALCAVGAAAEGEPANNATDCAPRNAGRGRKGSCQSGLGGSPAPKGRYPYIVSLRDANGDHACAGVLIHPRWVATVAHCVDSKRGFPSALKAPFTVFIGGLMIDEYEEMAVVSTIILHNFWSGSPARGFDFALLQLPLNSSQQPVKLISDDAVLVEEEPLAIAGWGRVQGSGPFALTLQEADELPFISPERCEPTDIGSAAQDLLCVGVGKAGSCAGDQGGPLIRKNSLDPQNSTLDELVGIVTSIPSASCAQLGLPSVCTGIQKVSTFIELNIKDLER